MVRYSVPGWASVGLAALAFACGNDSSAGPAAGSGSSGGAPADGGGSSSGASSASGSGGGGSGSGGASTGSSSGSTGGGTSGSSSSSGGGSSGSPGGVPGTVTGCTSGSPAFSISNGNVKIDYDLAAGAATFSYGGTKKVGGFFAQANLGTMTVTSKMYATRACATAMDSTSSTTTVTLSGSGLPTMLQVFMSDGGNHFRTQMSLEGTGLSSNWMGPVVTDAAGTVDVGSYGDLRGLIVPFDNDMFVRYNAAPLANAMATSFEVGAFYDAASRNGIVVGSLTHDIWKTGIAYRAGAMTLSSLQVFGGVTDQQYTHDLVPHGALSGARLDSPVVFVGYGPDWRDLMEEYAVANTVYEPMAPWTGGVPFGWNSWGVIQFGIDYNKAIAVSDFIKSNLQGNNFANNGVAYVDLDSGWNMLSDSELQMFAAHCHANGQKAGAYWGPFADWGGGMSQAQIRDGSGNNISIDGAPALDPTHPDVLAQIKDTIGKFKGYGMDYVKLDFLAHGTLESSVRADPSVKTGIQAYNVGMKAIADANAGAMFIDESIAPLFPYKYAQGRRIACDAFGSADNSNYELNSASYGWWLSGRVYRYGDPDQLVFQGFAPNENMLRLLSSIATGGIFFDGDDLTSPTGQMAATQNLTNAAFDAVARIGKPFRPADGNTGDQPANVLEMHDGADTYVVILNFGNAGSQAVDLTRVGLDGTKSHMVTDLWTGTTTMAQGMLNVMVDANSGKLLKVN